MLWRPKSSKRTTSQRVLPATDRAIAQCSAVENNDPIFAFREIAFSGDNICGPDTVTTGYFYPVHFKDCTLDGTRFQNCKFLNVTFTGCVFNRVCWDHIFLEDVHFKDCIFEDGVWRYDYLRDVTLADQIFSELETIGNIEDVPAELKDDTLVRKQQSVQEYHFAMKALGSSIDIEDPVVVKKPAFKVSQPVEMAPNGHPKFEHPYFPSDDATNSSAEKEVSKVRPVDKTKTTPGLDLKDLQQALPEVEDNGGPVRMRDQSIKATQGDIQTKSTELGATKPGKAAVHDSTHPQPKGRHAVRSPATKTNEPRTRVSPASRVLKSPQVGHKAVQKAGQSSGPVTKLTDELEEDEDDDEDGGVFLDGRAAGSTRISV